MRPRRMPFEGRWRTPSSPSVLSSLLPMVLLLAVALGMMVALQQEASRLRKEERPVEQLPSNAGNIDRSPSGDVEIVIDLALLDKFQDHSRTIAAEPFLYLLQLCRELSVEALRPLALQRFTYRDLLDRSTDYRGRVLAFRGRVRRIVEVLPPAGQAEETPYYEAWVFTADAGHLPYCVISAARPQGLPVARRMNEYCEVVGFYLGWWKHETADGRLLSSPIVVTPQLRPAPSPLATSSPLGGLELGIGGALALLLSVGLAIAVWLISRAGSRGSHVAEENPFREGAVIEERQEGDH